MPFTCPCCGYPDLSMAPYAQLSGPPVPTGTGPPYEDSFGAPSYEVCSCCGFEFGVDDSAGSSGRAESFEAHREDWLERDAPWFSPLLLPPGWDVDEQLAAAGIAPSRLHRLGVIVAGALAELLHAAAADADLLAGQADGRGTARQRFGAALDALLNGVLWAQHGWNEYSDGLAFVRCRRHGEHGAEVVALWHVGTWDATANSPWLVPIRARIDIGASEDRVVRLEAWVGERDPQTGSIVRYARESRAASHREVTILDDLDAIEWQYVAVWP